MDSTRLRQEVRRTAQTVLDDAVSKIAAGSELDLLIVLVAFRDAAEKSIREDIHPGRRGTPIATVRALIGEKEYEKIFRRPPPR